MSGIKIQMRLLFSIFSLPRSPMLQASSIQAPSGSETPIALPQPAGNEWLSPLVITLIGGVVSAVLASWIYDRIRSRPHVRVRRIKKSSDKDVEGFVQLYDRLINEHIRIDPSEIVSWIDEDRALRKVETHTYLHYLFVGKVRGDVVAFLKAMYCKNSQYLFVAYYGIDTTVEHARSVAAPAILKKLLKLISDELKDCKAIICEVEAPSAKLEQSENNARKARIRLFKETAKRFHHQLYEVGIDYLQPQMEVSESGTFTEESMLILYLPLNDRVPLNKTLSKEKVCEILRFVYLQIYSPVFRHEPEKNLKYQSYLGSLVELCECVLPDSVPLRE